MIVFKLALLIALATTTSARTKKKDATPDAFQKLQKEAKVTQEEMYEFFDKKDCSGYKPNKRIQCDISLYNANLITKDKAIDDILAAVAEWRKEDGVSDSMFLIGLDLANWALKIGHAELIVGTTYASMHMRVPRLWNREYVSHYKYSDKPTIVYVSHDMTGNEVPDHWSWMTAVEGDKKGNILYVSGGRTTEAAEKDPCVPFYNLPKSLSERKHVSVSMVLRGQVCTTIPSNFRVVISKMEKVEMKGFGSRTQWIPKWECSYPELECEGDMSDKELEEAESFLA